MASANCQFALLAGRFIRGHNTSCQLASCLKRSGEENCANCQFAQPWPSAVCRVLRLWV